MQLHEHEAKTILSRHGVRVPVGGIWPDVPPDLRYPVAAKAQVLAGGRGLHGGVRRVDSPAELSAAVGALRQMILLGESASGVLIEEWIPLEREFYLGMTVSREARSPVLLASVTGGSHVEESSQVLRMFVDPWIGPRPHHAMTLSSLFGLPFQVVSPVLNGIWAAFAGEDALMIEVNPFGIAKGELIALDVRMFLDDNARYRHESWPPPRGGTPFEQACAALGASGVEMDGQVALVTSGAGLGMASVDLLVSMDASVRALVDLGPVVFQSHEKIAQVAALLAELAPKVVVFNFFLQLAPCDRIAAGLAMSLARLGRLPVIVRMKGVRAEEARVILQPLGVRIYEDLAEAFAAAAALARA